MFFCSTWNNTVFVIDIIYILLLNIKYYVYIVFWRVLWKYEMDFIPKKVSIVALLYWYHASMYGMNINLP